MNARTHVRVSAPGWHHWPDASGNRAYLAQDHRHLFAVEVSTTVTHDGREIEFHDLRDAAETAFRSLGVDGRMGAMSCETMARRVGEALAVQFERWMHVAVWEDGECGASVGVRW